MEYSNIIAVTNRIICQNYHANEYSRYTDLLKNDAGLSKISEANRTSCRMLLHQIQRLAETEVKYIILREKDLPEADYTILAAAALEICKKTGRDLVLHSFINTAETLKHRHIHLPLHQLIKCTSRSGSGHTPCNLSNYETVGVSVHSADEAKCAEALGAAYITAGHIFETDCKKGLPGRGLAFLQNICSSVNIPVYAIGGINADNIKSVLEAGAAGGCMMSGVMGKLLL